MRVRVFMHEKKKKKKKKKTTTTKNEEEGGKFIQFSRVYKFHNREAEKRRNDWYFDKNKIKVWKIEKQLESSNENLIFLQQYMNRVTQR